MNRITTGVYIILVILLGLPTIPPIYRNMFAFPSVSLTASMACRVYRNIKLLDLSDKTFALPVSDIHFARENPTLKNDPQNIPSSHSMELRDRMGGTVSSGTLGPVSTTKSQSGWTEQLTDLRTPERSLTYEAKHHPKERSISD
jgi:hypothetical protein